MPPKKKRAKSPEISPEPGITEDRALELLGGLNEIAQYARDREAELADLYAWLSKKPGTTVSFDAEGPDVPLSDPVLGAAFRDAVHAILSVQSAVDRAAAYWRTL